MTSDDEQKLIQTIANMNRSISLLGDSINHINTGNAYILQAFDAILQRIEALEKQIAPMKLLNQKKIDVELN